MASSFAILLLYIAAIGAVYGIVAPHVKARFGGRGLVILLLGTSVVLAGVAVVRLAVLSDRIAYRPAVDNPLWMGSLFAGWLMFILLPLTWRVARMDHEASGSALRLGIAAIPWVFLGFAIALFALFVLDVTGVPFLPNIPVLGAAV